MKNDPLSQHVLRFSVIPDRKTAYSRREEGYNKVHSSQKILVWGFLSGFGCLRLSYLKIRKPQLGKSSGSLEQVPPSFLLPVGRILDLDPIPYIRIVLIPTVCPFCHNAFEV